MEIRRVESGKWTYLPLLLVGDEQEDMIARYLDRGTLLALYDGGLRAVCVVTAEGPGVFEIKNLAVEPAFHRRGYGRAMVEQVGCRRAAAAGWHRGQPPDPPLLPGLRVPGAPPGPGLLPPALRPPHLRGRPPADGHGLSVHESVGSRHKKAAPLDTSGAAWRLYGAFRRLRPSRPPSGPPPGPFSPRPRPGPPGPCGRKPPAGGKWACAGPGPG